MIKEIKYVGTSAVDYFTCHALFSTITDNALSKMKLNSYSKQPEYKISFQDRVITILLNLDDFQLPDKLPASLDFQHQGKVVKLVLYSDELHTPKNTFKEGDFVFANGVISYARKLTTEEVFIFDSKEVKRKHKSPINPMGNFAENERESALKYLENKLGLDVKTQIDTREFRFEMISYKHFENRDPVYSKSNNNRISLHNVFSFEIHGYIKNSDITNSLEYTSIGKKRSYGFGNVYIKNYEQKTI